MSLTPPSGVHVESWALAVRGPQDDSVSNLERTRRIRNWMILGSLILGVAGLLVGELVLNKSWMWFVGYVVGGAFGAGLGWLTTRSRRVPT